MSNIEDDIKIAINRLSPQSFEEFCQQVMPLANSEYESLNSNRGVLGKTTKGTPDAYVRDTNGNYIAFQFTTQQQGVKEKVLSDIAVLNSDKCHFSQKIRKVVICITSNMSSEIELCHQAVSKYGWESDIYTLDTLVRLIKRNPKLCFESLGVYLPSTEELNNLERFYLCGARIQELRAERRLLPSQFIELIEHYSERSWIAIESNQEECSLSTIDKVIELTHVNEGWIRHGIGEKYSSKSLPYHSISGSIELIENLEPMELYFCLNTENFELLILVKLSEYKWCKFYVAYRLDFWNWFDDHSKMPEVFEHFTGIYKHFDNIYTSCTGRLYTNKEFKKLHEDSYTGAVIKTLPKRGEYWASDIRDLNHTNTHLDYEGDYGEWFLKIQSYARRN